ncbi:T9SS type A sorting domain-containing protein [Lewinella sp. IMCC34191]|uniref:T9SS type A sorting domain-containing protein n=1 Tax=Lewinella sp. IMCC34191 TaxID=2259172 RepID=UPI000E284004|nr:T9SS type A sorting domain-containing protein [Lewinella sp. IMCC34191]
MKNLLYLLLFLPIVSRAQSSFILPQDTVTHRNDLAISPTGDRIIIGEVAYEGQTSVDFDPGPAEKRLSLIGTDGGFGTYVASYTPAGELNFVFAINDPERVFTWVEAYYVETDNAGNIYLQGSYYGSADFDPGPDTYRLSASRPNEDRIFVASYTAAGEFRFALDFPHYDPPIHEWVKRKTFDVDGDGNVYVINTSLRAFDYDPGPGEYLSGTDRAVLASYDSTGALRYAFPTVRLPALLSVGHNGDFYLMSEFRSEDVGFDYDPSEDGEHYPDAKLDSTGTIIAAYDREGRFLFAHPFAGQLVSVDLMDGDADGNVYIAGFQSPVSTDYAPGPDTKWLRNPAENADVAMYLAKYTRQGELLLADTLADANPEDAYNYLMDYHLTPEGNLYLSGMLSASSVDFDRDPDAAAVVEGGVDLNHRAFVASYDANLDYRFAYTIDGTEGKYLRGRPLHFRIEPSGDCGEYVLMNDVALPQTIDFLPGDETFIPEPASETEDSYGVALVTTNYGSAVSTPNCDQLSNLGSAPGRSVTYPVTVSPNPSVSGIFTVDLSFAAGEVVHYLIVDVSGRVIRRGVVHETSVSFPLDMQAEPAGMYTVRFWDGESAAVAKVIRGGGR